MSFGLKNCPSCEGEGYAVVPSGELASAVPCDCVPACERCGGSGRVLVVVDGVQRAGRCRCQMLPDRIHLFNLARIPARLAHAAFRTLDYTKEITPVVGQLSQWLSGFEQDRKGIILYGDVGRGKTHLLVSAIRALVFRHGLSVRFVEFSHLLAELREGFDSGKGQEGTMAPLLDVDVLAIDELGRGRHTEWELTIIDTLISRRYNAMRPVIGTTNYVPGPPTGRVVENLAAPGEPLRLADRVGSRVYSRLQEMCTFIKVAGPDFRQKDRGWL